MKRIKKVNVTPVASNTGTIIDSFSTSDNKHLNAPSIAAVEGYVGTVQTATGTVTQTLSSGDYTFNLTFRRNANVVTITVDMTIPILDPASTQTGVISASSLVNINDIFPEWAKVSYGGTLDRQNISNSISSITAGNTHFIGLTEYHSLRVYKNSSGSYMIGFLMSTSLALPEGATERFFLKYIVD